MQHVIDEDNIYHIYDTDGKELLKIMLTDEPGNQIILETNTEKFAGPVKFLFN